MQTNTIIKLACTECGAKPRNHQEVMQLNNLQVCHACISRDHIYSDYTDTMCAEAEVLNGVEREQTK